MGGWARVVPHAHSPPLSISTPHGWVPKDKHPNGQEKHMCRLESSGDRIGLSPWVQSWKLKAILFFKPFLLRGSPRAPCGIVSLVYEGHDTHQLVSWLILLPT